MSLVKTGWALLIAAATLATSLIVAPPAGALPTIPAMPDLAGFATVPALVDDGGTYFRTTDGLRCKLTADTVDCVGPLPGTGVDANAIRLGRSISVAGPGYGGRIPGVRLIDDSEASSIDKYGDASPTLRAGNKVVTGDSECAVADGERTTCTVGRPVREWLVVSQSGSGVGPATPGLPAGYPDPIAFVQGHVGAANVRFPSYFTVAGPDGELRCEMSLSGASAAGCDGDLPGTDANEVSLDGGGVKVVQTDSPRFQGSNGSTPPRLPVGYGTAYPGECIAIGGGVACYLTYLGNPPNRAPAHGFKVDAGGVTSF